MSQTAESLATAAGGVLAGLAIAGLWALRLRTLQSRARTRITTLRAGLVSARELVDRLHGERDEYHLQANQDETTGIPNRRAAIGRLTRDIAEHQQVGAVVLDLNRFKAINDRLGHRNGNILLAQVGQRLQHLAPPDVYAARLSGDEFTLIVAGDATRTASVADTAWRQISQQPYTIAGRQIDIIASVGWTTTTDTTGGDPELLLHHADIAMYWAKTLGGGVVRYTDDMGDHTGNGRPRDRTPTHNH